MIGDKRGQIAEGSVWLVGTIVIVFILGITIFISTFQFDGSKVIIRSNFDRGYVSEGIFGFFSTPYGGESVYSHLVRDGNFFRFTGKLASNLFRELYSSIYPSEQWAGVRIDGALLPIEKNDYFSSLIPSVSARGDIGGTVVYNYYFEEFYLTDKSKLLILLRGESR